jgi:transposase
MPRATASSRTLAIAARLAEGGISYSAVGREFGVSRQRVETIAKKAGLRSSCSLIACAERRARREQSKRAARARAVKQIEAVRKAIEELGMSIKEAAAHLRIPHYTVAYIVQSRGFRCHRQSGNPNYRKEPV